MGKPQAAGSNEPAAEQALCAAEVNRRLKQWRQGDLLIGVDLPFVTFAHRDLPLTAISSETIANDDDGGAIVDVLSDEPGYCIISQSCDLVRGCCDRPYVELAPLVPVDPATMQLVQKGRVEKYAPHPLLAEQGLVVDLDRVMVVEKPVLADLDPGCRQAGLQKDDERRRFAATLARKRGRFAFPDDFVAGMRRLRDHIVSKHAKNSPLGGFLEALAEIRMFCPDWSAAEPDVTMLLVFDEGHQIPADAKKHADDLAGRFTPTGVFKKLAVQVAAFETMSAARYRASDLLELDFLSQAND
jgi:hypothetical protein